MRSNTYVLYLETWGTASKAQDGELDPAIFGQLNSESVQRRFTMALRESASAYPDISIFRVGDMAYAASTDLASILKFTSALFQMMLIDQSELAPCPLRAGISSQVQSLSDLTENTDSSTDRVSLTFYGKAWTESAKLEKSGQKGMRVLISPEVAEVIKASRDAFRPEFLIRESNARGLTHYELNWMGDGFSEAHRQQLVELSQHLFEAGDNFHQQLGASLSDMLRWSEKGQS